MNITEAHRAKLVILLDRVNDYKKIKSKLGILECARQSDCSRFTHSDSTLADLYGNIKSSEKAKSIPSMTIGSSVLVPNLRAKCGNCCSSISYKVRNAARRDVERVVFQFERNANVYVKSGLGETGSDVQPYFQQSMKKKNPMQ